LMSLLVTMKGLPLAYNKDMQEDKEPVFDAALQWQMVVGAMAGMVEDFVPDTNRMHELASHGYSTATDFADWLVKNLKLPFRQAHHATARVVKLAAEKKCMLHELSLEQMQTVESRISKDVYSVLSVEKSVASRVSHGGTAPAKVKEAIKAAKKKYL
jgi:argininosuccinate lyase